ncbi:probable G-protein coupled receptor frpr-1 [Eurytemora carolleeae]|uniref:probable G-protein coupled receptor frpr-1 n=1 Tax=Eurytemora carolleeae TaxID=1294199 RepID=UPI000C76614A|nr:probable G-protein coupled receptor frpr-1 [Eurytemora carolleeae]|eukprot:XP_023340150.1 probable G-protein coupled receptor frpr-1 [Eurytemora affinis]
MLIKMIFEGILLPIIGGIGILGNVLSLLVLYYGKLDFQKTFIQLLTVLSVFDIISIVSNILLFSGPLLFQHYRLQILPHLLAYLLLPVAQIAMTGSVLTTLAVSVERFIAVCRPHVPAAKDIGRIICSLIVFFSILLNLNRFMEYETKLNTIEFPPNISFSGAVRGTTNQSTNLVTWSFYTIKPTPTRLDPKISQIAAVSSILILNILPFFAMSILNICIYRSIKKRSQLINSVTRERRNLGIATILVSIVLVFVLCHSPKCVINFLELIAVISGIAPSWGPGPEILVTLSHFLITANSSANFIIYCFKDEGFRNSMISIITCFRRGDPSGRRRGSRSRRGIRSSEGVQTRQPKLDGTDGCQGYVNSTGEIEENEILMPGSVESSSSSQNPTSVLTYISIHSEKRSIFTRRSSLHNSTRTISNHEFWSRSRSYTGTPECEVTSL